MTYLLVSNHDMFMGNQFQVSYNPPGSPYVTINVTYILNNNHTNDGPTQFVWLLLSVYVTLIVT